MIWSEEWNLLVGRYSIFYFDEIQRKIHEAMDYGKFGQLYL